MAQINKPSEYFNTVLYTGDGSSTRSLTGVNFQPDLVWLKRRNDAASHTLYDVVRGAGSTKGIATNSTAQEGLTSTEGTTANFGYVNSFDSDGFSVTAGATSAGYVNASSDTYASWNWLAGGTGVSNTDGDITSTVSANTTSGFSIVTYTGTGANATIGHVLGSAPKMVIVKRTNTTGGWTVYHSSVGNTKYLYLNNTNAEDTSLGIWNNTSPTSSVFTVGTDGEVNGSGSTYIAYCFAEKKGFSKFGSYTGNGSADGTFIYTGFKPAFLMLKKTSGVGDWFINDIKRNTFNFVNTQLYPNLSDPEENTGVTQLDILSNGFKLRGTTSNALNSGSATYIYMAFASEPLVSTAGVPCTAR